MCRPRVEGGLVGVDEHLRSPHVAARHLDTVQVGDEAVVVFGCKNEIGSRSRLGGRDGEGLAQVEARHAPLDLCSNIGGDVRVAESDWARAGGPGGIIKLREKIENETLVAPEGFKEILDKQT